MRPIVDYLIVIPLDEEFSYVRDVVQRAVCGSRRMRSVTIGAEVYSLALVQTTAGPVSVVLLSVGRMTEAPVQAAVEAAVKVWRPAATILIGIAGTLEPDAVRLGDVIVPRRIVGYVEAKAERDPVHGFRLVYRPTGHSMDCDLSAQARATMHNHLRSWQANALRAARADPVLARKLGERGAEASRPRLHIHDNDQIASGSVVVATKAFADALRAALGDAGRTVKAVEMEAKGFCEALARTKPAPQALVVRGISDCADEEKARLEADFKDGWRRFAAQNAARFALAFIVNRPDTAEGYRPVALPALGLVPHVEAARLCMEERMDARGAGMRGLAFVPLLAHADGAPGTVLKVEAFGADGRPVAMRDLLLRDGRTGQHLARAKGSGVFRHRLERDPAPPPVDLLVGLDREAARLTVQSVDEFGRTAAATWPT